MQFTFHIIQFVRKIIDMSKITFRNSFTKVHYCVEIYNPQILCQPEELISVCAFLWLFRNLQECIHESKDDQRKLFDPLFSLKLL